MVTSVGWQQHCTLAIYLSFPHKAVMFNGGAGDSHILAKQARYSLLTRREQNKTNADFKGKEKCWIINPP